MFGCIYQLWDWLEAPPLFQAATMDAKKLQQLQQAKKYPLAYQSNINDYCTTAHTAAVFQQHQQHYQQSPTTSSFSGLTPIDMQPQPNKLLLKQAFNSNSSSSTHSSSPYQQSPSHRIHNPATALQQQYQQLQQAKIQAQMQTQQEALQQQQRTFALRQALNPPVPQNFYTQLNQQQQQQQHQQQLQQQQHQSQQHNQRAPPSSLKLASQFQPANGPLKVQPKNHYQEQQQQQHNQHNHHQQQQQQQQSPVYIQQNHPGHVVNQACQTQISAVKSTKATPSSEESSIKSPLERKKSASSIQALKSPITKRPITATVTLSGWLYKQGSEGLKVWRKRWFVLSEYCLYYYKGSEEEKLLGSILLPSYRVSACLPEDKIYRKYAFKCEHQNMRTYWLAAESSESMLQWLRALSAASMMQASAAAAAESESQQSQPSGSSDSGINTLQSQQSKQLTPENGTQPLYANAPPKPRRINDAGYSSPSPEHNIRRSGMQQHAIYDARTGNVCSTLCRLDNMEYSKSPTHYIDMEQQILRLQQEKAYAARDLYMQQLLQQHYERRTPDAYGRAKQRIFSDYEDIYNLSAVKGISDGPPISAQAALLQEAASYRRPLSPPSYVVTKHVPPLASRYTPNHLEVIV